MAKNEIPGRLRVKVFHRDRQNAESVCGKAGRQKLKDIVGQNLRVARKWILPRGELRGLDWDWRKRFHFHRKKCGGEFSQLIDGRAALGHKIAERLEINNAPIRRGPVWSRGFEFIERLPRFIVDSEPVIRSRIWYGIKAAGIGGKGALEEDWQSAQVADRVMYRLLAGRCESHRGRYQDFGSQAAFL